MFVPGLSASRQVANELGHGHGAYVHQGSVRVVSRSILPRWGPIRFRPLICTYDAPPCGPSVRVDEPTKSRKIPTQKILPLFLLRDQGVQSAAGLLADGRGTGPAEHVCRRQGKCAVAALLRCAAHRQLAWRGVAWRGVACTPAPCGSGSGAALPVSPMLSGGEWAADEWRASGGRAPPCNSSSVAANLISLAYLRVRTPRGGASYVYVYVCVGELAEPRKLPPPGLRYRSFRANLPCPHELDCVQLTCATVFQPGHRRVAGRRGHGHPQHVLRRIKF